MPSKDDLLNSSNPLTKTLYKLWNDEELSEEDEELSGGGDDNEEENQEKEKNDDKEKERPEGGEEEEEEEEKEEEKNMNTQTTRNKSDFQFVSKWSSGMYFFNTFFLTRTHVQIAYSQW